MPHSESGHQRKRQWQQYEKFYWISRDADDRHDMLEPRKEPSVLAQRHQRSQHGDGGKQSNSPALCAAFLRSSPPRETSQRHDSQTDVIRGEELLAILKERPLRRFKAVKERHHKVAPTPRGHGPLRYRKTSVTLRMEQQIEKWEQLGSTDCAGQTNNGEQTANPRNSQVWIVAAGVCEQSSHHEPGEQNNLRYSGEQLKRCNECRDQYGAASAYPSLF